MTDLVRQMQLARFKHSQLYTRQIRVRHLQSISLRNYKPTKEPLLASSLEQLYFTLHVTYDERVIQVYESEHIKPSLNLHWQAFQLFSTTANEILLAAKDVVVRFWSIQNEDKCLFLELDVSLSGLVCLSHKATLASADIFPPVDNSVVFGIHDGLYIAASVETSEAGRFNATVAVTDMEADFNLVRSTYTLQTLSRLQTLLRALKQTEAKVGTVRTAIGQLLAKTVSIQKKREDAQLRAVRTSVLARELQSAVHQLKVLKEQRETLQLTNYQRDVQIKDKNDLLNGEYARLNDRRKAYLNAREELIKTGAHLVMRRKQLINDLSAIYPIDEINSTESKKELFICGVRLEPSENFDGYDEVTVSVALGYVSHLLCMLSVVLDVPLRYPVSHCGSRSLIYNYVDSQLDDKEREFCLFGKNREKFLFTYAVYLLNKDIAQLRYCCGMNTNDLRQTLHNLKSLLEVRLGITRSPPTRLSFLKTVANADLATSNGKTADSSKLTNGQKTARQKQAASSPRTPHKLLQQSAEQRPGGDGSRTESPRVGRRPVASGVDSSSVDDRHKVLSSSFPAAVDIVDSGASGSQAGSLQTGGMSQEHFSSILGAHEQDFDASSSEGSGTGAYTAQFAKLWSATKDTPSLILDRHIVPIENLGNAEPTFLLQKGSVEDVSEGNSLLKQSCGFSLGNTVLSVVTAGPQDVFVANQHKCSDLNVPISSDCDSSLVAADDFLERTNALTSVPTFQFVASQAGNDDSLRGILDASDGNVH